MTTAEPLVPGTVLGFRQFRIGERGQLLPLFTGDRPWAADTTTAVCATHPAHRPPVAECTCGLHAWHHPDDALARDRRGVVTAAVRAHGRIALGEHGLRAERADVVAVCLPARWSSRHRAEVTRRLAVAHPGVEVLTSARTFRRRFPVEDLAALGVRSRPTSQARQQHAVHVPWVLGVIALYSVVVWPPAMDRVIGDGGWLVLLVAFVAWQTWLVKHSLSDVETRPSPLRERPGRMVEWTPQQPTEESPWTSKRPHANPATVRATGRPCSHWRTVVTTRSPRGTGTPSRRAATRS